MSVAGSTTRGVTLASLALALAAGLAVYFNGRVIGGPFIFGDELEYFWYGRDIASGAALASHTQYGPLYPAIIALLLNLSDTESTYHALRIFNVVAFVSWVIPALLLSREAFPTDAAMRLLFTALVMSMPFSSLSYIGWVDTVHYALFLWAGYLLWILFREPTAARAALTGMIVGLLFYSKPGAGLVSGIAALAAVLAIFGLPPGERRTHRRVVTAFAIALALVIIPGAVRNMVVGDGITGYGGGPLLAERAAKIGYPQLVREIFSSLCYQLTYIFIASWGLLCVLAVVPILRWDALGRELRGMVIFLALSMVGLAAMSALGMSAFPTLNYWMPNGRYLSVVIPMVVLLGLRLLWLDPWTPARWGIAIAAVLLGALAARTSPLFMLAPYGFVNNTEMSIVAAIIDRGAIVWRRLYAASGGQLVGFAAIFAGLGLLWALLWPRHVALRVVCGLLLICNVAASVAAHRYVTMLGENQTPTNEIFRYLMREKVRPGQDVAFDKKMDGGNVRFVSGYWLGSLRVKYIEVAAGKPKADAVFDGRYFVSRQKLALPVEFRSGDLMVYSLGASPTRP